ncbi:MAG: hypothetical protein QOG99_1589 [Frankiales bacterium]|jgi:uncharacterized membrane protein|nr:hypothetical protein [Frankiales bacterium]MDX6216005.1 hypothetical protein [Frankiales bacterium]
MAERHPRRSVSRARLDQPVAPRGAIPRPHYDPEAFGRLSERIARFLGTSRFLVYLTLFCAIWILWNAAVPPKLQFDSYANKFTLLTLILSLQASYAAPLILLAQNRQTDRDRVAMEEDRGQNQRLQADVEYLTRELASLRLSLGETATRDFLRDQLRDLAEEVVARTSEGVFDQQARLQREERERRAERKRRRSDKDKTETPQKLSEPFDGEADSA